MSEKIQGTLIHVLSATIAGRIAHFISGQSLEGHEKGEVVGEVKPHRGVGEKATAKEGPAFDDDPEITPDYEERVYSHYGLSSSRESTERGAYGDYYGDDEDELRVQRSEEELRAGTHEREAGRMNVRKRVRTDRE